MEKLIFLDLETTGIDTAIAEIIQVAFITNDEGDSGYNSFFKPNKPIPPEVSGITNIDDLDVADKAPFPDSDCMKTLRKFASEGYVAVTHNTEYDLEILKRFNIVFDHSICTYRSAYKLHTDLGNHKLGTLRAYYKLPKATGNLHDALVDTLLLREVFQIMCKRFPSIEEFCKYSDDAIVEHLSTWKFGKYKGTRVDPFSHAGYIKWYLGEPEDPKFPKDKKFVAYLKRLRI